MIRQLTQEMAQSLCAAPEIEQKMEQLVGQLETVKGKKSYGYLPESVKKTVDEAVDKLEELLVVRECYDQWCILQNEVENYCHDKPRERKKLAQEKKFRQIKNAIIQEAENIRLGVMTFEDEKVEDRDEWVENWEVSYECLRLRAKIEDCRSISGTRRWEIWSSWQSTAISMPNTSWDCCIGTAGCSSRTLRKSGIGWNRRQNRIFRTRNTPWATGLTTTKIRRWIVSAWAA